MSDLHPIFDEIFKTHFSGLNQKADWYTLMDIKQAIARHLSAALIECSALSRDLNTVDPDQLMTDLRAEFDPIEAQAAIQDCFVDGFHAAVCQLKDAGLEPIARHKTLPSGVVE